ncbi:hypothetical protein PVK06_036382 [Gossypium arboreum]|uniref:Uncharacterized protein n=1 Tax=Gossypium arboreum TaxID=29729 RepID=A0ABR0NJE0_GOSAR|nr:hypothetical protein PVK06_036382 [Gossypium arboreum]
MIFKYDGEEDVDNFLLLPLFKCLPKDFVGGPTNFDNDDDAKDFGTMIVKFDCGHNARDQLSHSFKPLAAAMASPMRARRDRLDVDDDDGDEEEEEEDGDGEGFRTFVVRSTVRSEREGGDGGGGWDEWRELFEVGDGQITRVEVKK